MFYFYNLCRFSLYFGSADAHGCDLKKKEECIESNQ